MTASAEQGDPGANDLLSLGKRRALQAVSTSDQVFSILAVDHISALAAVARPDVPSSVTESELAAIKVNLVGSLAEATSGVLVDPVIGLEPVVRKDVLPGSVGLLVGLEDGDYASLSAAPRMFEGWDVGRAAASGANAVKCSFLYDPFAPSEAAHTFVSDLVADCGRHGVPLFAEPLVAQSLADRRSVVVETARNIGALGVDVLKLEFPSTATSPDAEPEWHDACSELTEASRRPWTLLSAGEDFDTFARQLIVACDAGASGYVAGRAVWQDLVANGVAANGPELAEARRRLSVLSAIAASHASPWTRWFPAATEHRDLAAANPEKVTQ
jgi:tagatose 1,6-diphosphate aldolase